MEPQQKYKLRYILIAVAAFAAVICLVALIFFRPDLLVNAFHAVIGLFMPFFYGIAIAYLLHPLSMKIEHIYTSCFDRKKTGRRKKLIRLLALLTALVIFLLIIIILILAVLPEIINSLSNIVAQIPSMLASFSSWIGQFDHGGFSHELVTAIQNAVSTLTTSISNFLKNGLLPKLQTLLPEMTKSIKGVLSVLSNFGLGCIISAYILGGWETFLKQIKLIVYAIFPKRGADWIRDEARIADHMFSGFVHGKILDSAIIGVICFLFTMITQMPYAMLISVLVGVTNLIPFFGPYLGAIPSAILIFTVSPLKCFIFVVFIIILQQVDGNVIGPKILGDRLGLSGFWILFAILVFGGMWGVFGMLVGAPLFAVLYDLIKRGIIFLLKKRGRTDLLDPCQKE